MAPDHDNDLPDIHLSDPADGKGIIEPESTGSLSISSSSSRFVQYSPDEIVQLVVMKDTLLLKLQALHDRGADLTWATTTFGVGVTLVVTILTSTFHSVFGLSGQTIQGVLGTITAVSLVVAVWRLSQWIRHRVTAEAIVKDIKEASVRRSSAPPVSSSHYQPPSAGL